MLSHSIYYRKSKSVSGSSPVIKYLTQRTLAVVMFIAVAIVGTIGGKESETKKPVPGKSTMTVTGSARQDESSGLTPMQSIGTMMSAFRDAFNDPSLIDYANQQGIGIPDSPTGPLLSGSNQQSTCSKSSLTQPDR